jgi:hypothetical protein
MPDIHSRRVICIPDDKGFEEVIDDFSDEAASIRNGQHPDVKA